MKKFLFLLISLFFIPIQAFIIEYVVFQKDDAPEVHLLFDVHTEDKNDEFYPMEQQHKRDLLQFFSKNNKNSKVIVEDLEELVFGEKLFDEEPVLMLDLLASECRSKGVHTVNVDCRALFSTARNVADIRFHFEHEAKQKKISQKKLEEIHSKLDRHDVVLHKVHQEFADNMNAIKSLQSNSVLAQHFQQQLKTIADRFNKSLGLLKDIDKTLYQNVFSMFTSQISRKAFLQRLDNLDNEFIDMKALYEIHKAKQEKKEKVFVVLGAFHSHNVSKVLPRLGYKKAWSAVQLSFDIHNLRSVKAINLLQVLQLKAVEGNLIQKFKSLFL